MMGQSSAMESKGKSVGHYVVRPRLMVVPVVFMLAMTFLLSCLLINAMQAILYLLLKPHSPRAYRVLNRHLDYSIGTQLTFLAEWWSGSDFVLYTDPETRARFLGKESAFPIINHTYEVDWIFGILLAGRLGVSPKSFCKTSLKVVPGIGWNWFFSECIFLERIWEKDQVTLGPQLERLVDYPYPMWLNLFAEGTRFSAEKHRLSMEVAESKGLPALKHHLLPRTKGFVACLPHLRGKIPAIYDLIVAIPKQHADKAQFRSLIYGNAPVTAHLLVRRITLDQVPEDPEKAALWLHELYQYKDRLMDTLLESATKNSDASSASFPLDREHGLEGYGRYHIPRPIYGFLNVVFWSTVTLVPLTCAIVKVFSSGNFILLAIIISVMLLAMLGIHKMINLTKISKASSYGSTITHKSSSVKQE